MLAAATKKITIKDFTGEEIKQIHNMMQRTWDVIAPDVLQVEAEMRESLRDAVSMKKAHVIEVVLDADHMQAYGGSKPEEQALYFKFKQLDYKDKIKIAKQTFTYATYGY
jgi:NAD(P)H-hydrate repair Nnr-like enzyme with NAD(P)H-hydrate dehydratase domain